MRMAQFARGSMFVLIVAATGAWTQAAPPKAQTATEFYFAYRAAFDKATKVEDLFPYVTAGMRKQVEATPEAQRPQMFGMMKAMNALTGVKVLKEEQGPDGSTVLTAEGLGADGKKQTGKITIVKEGGAWKLGSETWSG
jgi:hypothetical protein